MSVNYGGFADEDDEITVQTEVHVKIHSARLEQARAATPTSQPGPAVPTSTLSAGPVTLTRRSAPVASQSRQLDAAPPEHATSLVSTCDHS
ncbi:hypothetical protein BC629DRAFT_1538134 [Irpex lacteus]|nr:hypothetical protein BC629DRAFT_1538134 [Irpex lacteus]